MDVLSADGLYPDLASRHRITFSGLVPKGCTPSPVYLSRYCMIEFYLQREALIGLPAFSTNAALRSEK
jgi:hypothetical protein